MPNEHKVFFWLLLKDRLSTRDLLRRKNMALDSCACELCILQRLETVTHLFLRCNFAKACWASIGVSVITSRPLVHIINLIRSKLAVPFFMEITILMSWCIWTTRNDRLFNNEDSSVDSCRRKFIYEFSLVMLRAKPSSVPAMSAWIDSL